MRHHKLLNTGVILQGRVAGRHQLMQQSSRATFLHMVAKTLVSYQDKDMKKKVFSLVVWSREGWGRKKGPSIISFTVTILGSLRMTLPLSCLLVCSMGSRRLAWLKLPVPVSL